MGAPALSIIAAMTENRLIGRDGRLPWRLPADLRHFKALTLGKPILMGRRTWESLPGLLPNRRHLVISRRPEFTAAGAETADSLEAGIALAAAAEEIMIIGGAEVYRQALPLAERMHLTLIHTQLDGDAWFPEYAPSQWRETSRERRPADTRNAYALSFVSLVRRPGGG